MQFESNRKNRLILESVGLKDGSVSNVFVNQYPHSVNFYTSPPFGKISLEESEDMVAERLNRLSITIIEYKPIESHLINIFIIFDK